MAFEAPNRSAKAAMKHSSTRELFDYWNERRGTRPVPERAEIEPGAIRRILADTFILTFDPARGYPFRIAGTRVCAAFGRELKGGSLADLWTPDSQPLLHDVLNVVATECISVVVGAHTTSIEGVDLDLELLLLPLSHRGRTDARVLGLITPIAVPYWLGTVALRPLAITTHRYLGDATRSVASPGAAPSTPRLIRHGLVVYDGGQSGLVEPRPRATAAD
jgi:hypothetical protein